MLKGDAVCVTGFDVPKNRYRHMIRFPPAALDSRMPAPWFSNGLYIGRDDGPPKVGIFAATAPPALMVDAATNQTYEKGDVVWNSNPQEGGNLGWVCIQDGTQNTPNPAVFATFGIVDSPSKVFSVDTELTLADRYVTVDVNGVIITLPPSPNDGQTHAIKSKAGVTTKVNTVDELLIDGLEDASVGPLENRNFRYNTVIGEWEIR